MASATASASPQATSDSQAENNASVSPCDCAIQRYEDHVAAIQLSSKKDNSNTSNIDGKTKQFLLLIQLSSTIPT